MGINLGFESLGIRSDRSGDLSYEYLDSLIQFNNAATEVLDLCHELSGVVRTYSQLDAITKTIKKYGVTQSLEALYGENFSGAASMEAEAEEAKQGLWGKLKKILEDLWNKLTSFWKWLTDSNERALRAIDKLQFTNEFSWEEKAGAEKTPITSSNFTATKTALKDALEKAIEAVNKAKETLNKLKKDKSINAQSVENAQQEVNKATSDAKIAVANVNRFIAAAKKAAGGKGDKQNEGAADNAKAAGNQQTEQK